MGVTYAALISLLVSSIALGDPPILIPSAAVENEHPCPDQVVQYIESKLIAVEASGGNAPIDSLANLTRALKDAGVGDKQAEEIGKVYLKFRNKEMASPNLRRLAVWMDRFERNQLPSGVPPISAEMRSIVCVPDLKCSLSNPPTNLSYFPRPFQIFLVAPAPAPGVKPQPYINALLAGISHAQGVSVFEQWLDSVAALRETGKLKDPYAELFVKEGQYSGTFREIFTHLHGQLMQVEFIKLERPTDGEGLIRGVAQNTLPELADMQLPNARRVLQAIGIRSWKDVLPVAQKIDDQLNFTNELASAPNN